MQDGTLQRAIVIESQADINSGPTLTEISTAVAGIHKRHQPDESTSTPIHRASFALYLLLLCRYNASAGHLQLSRAWSC